MQWVVRARARAQRRRHGRCSRGGLAALVALEGVVAVGVARLDGCVEDSAVAEVHVDVVVVGAGHVARKHGARDEAREQRQRDDAEADENRHQPLRACTPADVRPSQRQAQRVHA